MFTGNILHQVALGVTTALSFGFAPHESPCPLAHRTVVSSDDSDASVLQASRIVRHEGYRARITVSF